MGFRQNRVLLGKVLFLLVILLVVGLSGFGCIGIKSTPEGGSGGTIADGTLYVSPTLKAAGGFGCAPQPTVGKLVAVNISGGRLWEVTLGTSRPAGGGFGCAPASKPVAIYGTPVVAGDLVYVGGYNGKIYAVNSSSGALRWVYPRQDDLQPIVGGLVAAWGKVFFGCSDGKVYALDAATGDKEWEFLTGDKIWSTPTVDDDILYIGSLDKKLYALDTADGSKKWEFEAEGAITATALVYNGTVYIGSFDRHLYAVKATDGSLRWKFMAESWFWARPVAFNNTIYAGALDGKVYVLNAGTGVEEVPAFDLGSPISSSPVLVEGKVIIASEEGVLYSLNTANNQIRELKNLEEEVYAPLSASQGTVYIHTEKDVLYALDTQIGVELWGLPLSNK